MSEYKPVQCSLHDIIEDRIVRSVQCIVLYRSESDEATASYSGRLTDVFSRDGAEFLQFERGDLVRLDRILKLDEVDFTGGASAKRQSGI